MNKATELLNAIAAELNTTDKTLCINVAMAMMVKAGASVEQAMNTLFGEGAYVKFAGQIYDALKAKTA